MGKIISVFNHKGGVGKTTLVHNVGVALANLDKRVLFIDADPQMNVTASFHGFSDSVEYDNKVSETTKSKWKSIIKNSSSIYSVIKNSMAGEKYKPKLVQKNYKGNSLSILNGSIKLASLETDINLAIATQRDIQGQQLLRVQNTLLSLTKNYDIVFIDTPPGAGSGITSFLVRLSDYLITPVSPTFFSLQAIDNLKEIFLNWNKSLSWLSECRNIVKFIGCVVQMGKRHTGGSNNSQFSQTTTQWTQTLNKRLTPFQEWMMSTGNSISKEEFATVFPKKTPFIIEVCCDFTQQLRTIAEKAGVPIICLNQELCDRHKPSKSAVNITKDNGQYAISFQNICEQYNGIASSIANKLL